MSAEADSVVTLTVGPEIASLPAPGGCLPSEEHTPHTCEVPRALALDRVRVEE
jgi:hypothetical protein